MLKALCPSAPLCAAEPWSLQPFPMGPCLLAPVVWGCSLLPGSPLKSHFTIPGFLLLVFKSDGEQFICSCARNCTQLSSVFCLEKFSLYFLHIAKLLLASHSACQELLPPGSSPAILTGGSLINVLGGFGAFPSHFPVVSATPAPFIAHTSSALSQAQSGRLLQHCLWCFPNPPGAVRDAGME